MKQSEVDFMKKTYPNPPDINWYKNIAIPCSWRLIHGRMYNKKVLDIGCATGWISYLAKEEGAEIIATDIFDSWIDKNIIPFQLADKENLPFSDNIFDFVITANVLHHGDLYKTTKEAHRVLKSGGEFISLQEPCISNEIDEENFLKDKLKKELDLGIDEHRPNLIKYRESLKIFNRYSFYKMTETVMGNAKQPFLEVLPDDSFNGGIAIHAIK